MKTKRKNPQKRKNTLKNLGLHTKFSILTSRAIQCLSYDFGTIFSPAFANLKEKAALLKRVFLCWRR